MSHKPTDLAPHHRLDERVQRWIYQQGWKRLHDIQNRAIEPILEHRRDVILAAPTAGGKTEAAFLPICTHLLQNLAKKPGYRVICVSPLKALINDQFGRLDLLCRAIGLRVDARHGDIPTSTKQKALKRPGDILLITPESLESLFVNRSHELPSLIAPLEFFVIDELHAFFGTERGRQVQSLLARLDTSQAHIVPRVGLSATLGDLAMAADFLRPGREEPACVIESREDPEPISWSIRAHVEPDVVEVHGPSPAMESIATELFDDFRGRDNLVFANSRARVEGLSDTLRQRCEEARVPCEFFPHHGNLSKEHREDLESALRSARPATAICTSTLELGIDIGSVHAVAQIGPAPSVASLRQRLGRSGRREDEAPILRQYVVVDSLGKDARVDEPLRLSLFRSLAMIDLIERGWSEPLERRGLHLSTLVQQTLSTIRQLGGATAQRLFEMLCVEGPFLSVDPETYIALLRSLSSFELVHQPEPQGPLMLGSLGEKVVQHYRFYAAFQSLEELRVVFGGKTLGTLPASHMLQPEMHIIFAGRRWQVTELSWQEKRISVEPSPAGTVVAFGDGVGWLHEEVLREMYRQYSSDVVADYLDPTAVGLLRDGRDQFNALGLDNEWIISLGQSTLLFPWLGTSALHALVLALKLEGLPVDSSLYHVIISAPEIEVRKALERVHLTRFDDSYELAITVSRPESEKNHKYLDDDLLARDYASMSLDTERARLRVGMMLEEKCVSAMLL